MSTWPSVKVGAIAEQIRGVTYAKEEASRDRRPGSVPLLRAMNITDEGLAFDDLLYVPQSRVSREQVLLPGDLVIAASSGSLDVVGKAAQLRLPFCGTFGAFCKALRPSDVVDPTFFAHFFRTRAYRRRISSLAAGVNINNLRNEHLDDLDFPLPPLDEQRRIAAILDAGDMLRAKRRAALAQLDAMAWSIFVEMFGDPERNPRGWRETLLENIIATGPQNGLYKPLTSYGDGIPILRIDSFYDGAVTKLGNLKRLRLSADVVQVYSLREHDIVVNRVNSMEYLGKSALIPSFSEPTVFESNMMRFTLNRSQAHPRFIIQLLQSSFIKDQIRSAAKHAINQSSINQTDVRRFRVLCPPTLMQEQFALRLDNLDRLKTKHRQSQAGLDSLFASLQHRAFHDKL